MDLLVNLARTIITAVEVWSPMQLLLTAALTVVLGYLGIVSRFATR